MGQLNETYLVALTDNLAPMPWVLDACNNKCVCVKDSCGNNLYVEDLEAIPDGVGSEYRDLIIQRAKLFAQWLVAFSNDRCSNITEGQK